FSLQATLDRIGQVAPKVMFLCHGYDYNGKTFRFKETADRLIESLPSLRSVVVVDRHTTLRLDPLAESRAQLVRYQDIAERNGEFEWRRFGFNDPALV